MLIIHYSLKRHRYIRCHWRNYIYWNRGSFRNGMMHYICIIIILTIHQIFAASELNTVKQALEYVFQVREGTCGAGTGEVLPLQFDVTVWSQYTDPAIRTANFLSKIIEMNNGSLDSLTDELFFLLVRNNVHGDSMIFGSAIAVENGVYSKYDRFCPYAYKKNGTVRSHDLSVNYNYFDPNTEWYNSIKIKIWKGVNVVTDEIMYRKDDHHLPEVEEPYPIAKLPDGHWTVPYFDCGGGDVWMVTYSSPIFRVDNGSVLFRGVATIDIELTYIDINQCDDDISVMGSGLDVFRGTHRCQPTTQCVPVKGQGFVTGAYLCKCDNGFYFPNNTYRIQAYTGDEIENHLRKYGVIKAGQFQCIACAAGCKTCVDNSPCFHYHNDFLKASLLILTIITVLGISCIALIIYINKNMKVIKSASPAFLELMCLGGILVCSQFFTELLETNVLMCTIRIWPQHVGFVILYGSLVIKTWRISMIFTIGARKRVSLPDAVLHKRLAILLLAAIAILAVWTTSSPPEISALRTSDNLIFYVCKFGIWEYTVIGAEVILLLYGVYLSFTIRKAPAQFSDKFMAYAIYNAIILGLVMSLVSRLFIPVTGPDMILVLEFVQVQVYASVTLLIIFIPKFLAVRKERNNQVCKAIMSQTSILAAAGRFKSGPSVVMDLNVNFLNYMVEQVEKSTQTTENIEKQTAE